MHGQPHIRFNSRTHRKPTNQNPAHNTHPEAKTIRSIQRKLKEHDAKVTRADKGNTLVILPTHQYETNLQDFIKNNEFHTKANNPTKTFQTQIRSTIKHSPTLIDKDHRWKYTNMNPSAPSSKGLIKIHKPDQPICLVVNWHNAPAYKLSKLFTKKVNQLAPLPHSFNIKNTQDLLNDPENTPILPHYNLASLDVTNLHTNISVKEIKTIFTNIPTNSLMTPQTQQELLSWYDVIIKQNYFTHDNQIIFQHDGVAMGAPSSGLITDIFLQHIEHSHITDLIQKHGIINYCRYVDDILITFDPNQSDIQIILNDFNSIHPKLRFTADRRQLHTKLLGSIHTLNTHRLENRHFQKTHIYRHHHTVHVQPPHTTQICRCQIPVQQTRVLQATTKGIPTRTKHNTQHPPQ
jgi:hypothetical protein